MTMASDFVTGLRKYNRLRLAHLLQPKEDTMDLGLSGKVTLVTGVCPGSIYFSEDAAHPPQS